MSTASEPGAMPENTGLYSVESATVREAFGYGFPPPCDGCGDPSAGVWPSPFDGVFYVCGDCAQALPGVTR